MSDVACACGNPELVVAERASWLRRDAMDFATRIIEAVNKGGNGWVPEDPGELASKIHEFLAAEAAE